MDLSVVIPVRNGAACIGDLLASLRAQALDGLACEVIVVDDASTDRTPQALAAHPWLTVVRHERRRGAGAARNTGARRARGRLLVFLDADTRVVDEDFLPRVAAFFERHPEQAAVSGCYTPQNRSPTAFARYLDACEAAMHERALDGPAPGTLNGCVCALRKSVFDALGGFDEDPRVALEDPDLGCRLAAAGHGHWFSGELRVEHRQPGLWAYVRELVPRTRHYVHLIRRHGLYNEAMGGRSEGVQRSLFLLGVLLLAGGLAAPALAGTGLALLAVSCWQSRPLWRRLAAGASPILLVAAPAFHLATTLALVSGTLLACGDVLVYSARRRLVDGAVLLAYLRSLLSPGGGGQLIHFLTHRCNAHCAHCFDEAQRNSIAAAQELDLPRIRTLAASTGRLAHVSLTGGEPLLRRDVAEILAAWYAGGVRSFTLNTNGSQPARLAALLPKLAAAAPWARIVVTVSVDGVGATHDRLRGKPGLYRSVERTLAALCRARQWLPQLRVYACMTLSAANLHEIDAVLAALAPLHLDQLEFSRLRGMPVASELRGITDAEHAAACAKLVPANESALGLAALFSRLDRAVASIQRQAQAPWPCGPCLAGRRLAVVQADGTVLPCEMLRTTRARDAAAYDGFVLGRLAEHGDDLAALLASPQARRVVDYIRDTDCRCAFECAIFTTMAYRPWRLWRFLMPPAPRQPAAARSGSDAAPAPADRRSAPLRSGFLLHRPPA